MNQEIKSIEGVGVAGKRVILRTSLNVPIGVDGEVSDIFRLQAAVPTVEWLSKNGARTVLLAHLGRKGDSLKEVVAAFAKLLPSIAITFFEGTLAEAKEKSLTLHDGEVLVLENVRSQEGEESNNPALAQEFASLGELYVDDAFADAHRTHASIVGVAKLLPSYAGLLMMQEVMHLTKALTPPEGSLAIIGGAKFETKLPLIKKLLEHYSRVLLGGALANDLFKARGLPFGASLISAEPVPKEISIDPRVVMPIDGTFSDADANINTERTSNIGDVRADERIVDIGPKTAVAWSAEIAAAPFVVWNGPTGVYERGFTMGTDALAKALTESGAQVVVGGGDTLAAVQKFTFDREKVFLSTGGGAMLEFLTSGTLAGLEALKK